MKAAMDALELARTIRRAQEKDPEAFDALVDRGPKIRDHLGSTMRETQAEALEAGRLIGETFVGWQDRQGDVGGDR